MIEMRWNKYEVSLASPYYYYYQCEQSPHWNGPTRGPISRRKVKSSSYIRRKLSRRRKISRKKCGLAGNISKIFVPFEPPKKFS